MSNLVCGHAEPLQSSLLRTASTTLHSVPAAVHRNQQQRQQSASMDPQRDRLVQQGFVNPNREPQRQAAPSGARASDAAADAAFKDPLTEAALLDGVVLLSHCHLTDICKNCFLCYGPWPQ